MQYMHTERSNCDELALYYKALHNKTDAIQSNSNVHQNTKQQIPTFDINTMQSLISEGLKKTIVGILFLNKCDKTMLRSSKIKLIKAKSEKELATTNLCV